MRCLPQPGLTLLDSASASRAASQRHQPSLPSPDQDAGARSRLRIGVLGPLVITGTAGGLQPRQAELVVALGVAGTGGLSTDALRDRLGDDPDHPVGAESFRQLITRTRRRLGPAPAGGEYITYDGTGRYQLDPSASLDWHDFRGLARRGHKDRDPRPLRSALKLVRGEPVDGLYWWWLDPLIDAVRTEVVEAAVQLACLELEAGDPVSARRAALAGLAADPAAEPLWRQLMLAEDAAGNMAGVHRVWARCLQAIADIAPAGEPHQTTAALYRAITTAKSGRPMELIRTQAPAALRARLLIDRRSDGRAAG